MISPPAPAILPSAACSRHARRRSHSNTLSKKLIKPCEKLQSGKARTGNRILVVQALMFHVYAFALITPTRYWGRQISVVGDYVHCLLRGYSNLHTAFYVIFVKVTIHSVHYNATVPSHKAQSPVVENARGLVFAMLRVLVKRSKS